MPEHLPIAGTAAVPAVPGAGGPRLGLRAVLTRFLVDLIETLPQALLRPASACP
jgi:hypothetical protein